MEGHEEILGLTHPKTLMSVGNIGVLLHQLGKLTEAEILI
jgi:hypothetical protein